MYASHLLKPAGRSVNPPAYASVHISASCAGPIGSDSFAAPFVARLMFEIRGWSTFKLDEVHALPFVDIARLIDLWHVLTIRAFLSAARGKLEVLKLLH